MDIVLAIIAIVALVLSILAFVNKGKKEEVKAAPAPAPVAAEQPKKDDLGEIGRVNAVIALALNQYLEDVHDYENTVLTINKIVRPYSPWSSKIYGLRQIPQVIKTRK
jgi:Na+-transporting methylmalonyl-CoA/oxaloacetate decarboxylase gamma subunit